MEIVELLRRDAEACARSINPPHKGSSPDDYLSGMAANEIGRLRAAFRVNMLRYGATDAEIDAVLYPNGVVHQFEILWASRFR